MLLLIFLSGVWSGLPAQTTTPALRPVTLQLKWHHQFQFAGYYAAQAKGFYAAEGLSVTIRPGSEKNPPIPAVLAGQADFGIGDADVLLARLGGKPLVACAAIFQHSPYIILSREDRNIRTPADLIGARVMISTDQGAAQFRLMLAREGIDARHVNIVPHSWNLDDLIERRVDAISAYVTVEPTLLRGRGVTPSILRSGDYGVDFYGDVLFTTEAGITTHPDRTTAFVRASLRGWQYAFDHPGEIADLILGLDGVAARGVTREMLLEEARLMRPLVLPDVVEIGHMNPDRWQQIATTYAAQGVVKKDLSLAGFLYDSHPPFDATKLWWTSGATLGLLLILGLVLLWNMQMRRSVQSRTRELRDSEERFRQLAENINEVFWVTDLTKQQMLYVSPAYAAIWGRSCESLYAAPRTWLESIHPSDRTRVQAAAVTHQASGQYDETYRIVRPDGTVRWIHDRAFPVRDADGQIYRVVGTAEDITERKQSEQRIAEQAALLDLAQDAIVVTDLDFNVRYWNQAAARIYGWTAPEIIGRSLSGLVDIEDSVRPAREAMRNRDEWRGELQRQTKTGGLVSVESRWTLVRDELGRPKSILTISTDLTERKKIEAQFLRAQRLESIGTLAGGIAHDLNNLLTPILMGVGLMRQLTQDATLQRIVDNIEHSASRGTNLVKQVLSFSRGIEGARMTVQLRNLGREMQNIVTNTFPKNITFECEIPGDSWLVSGDPTQLSQVLLNLLVNARDAMPRGGQLTLTARNILIDEQYAGLNRALAQGRYLRVDITDTGTGIPAEIIDKIFDPFFTTKEPGKGTGLGLATAQGIVRSHGGWLGVDSKPGRGTVFHLYLPALPPGSGEDRPETAATLAELPRGHGELILLVDDEAAVLTITRQTLETFGYRVITAENGAQAIGLFALHAAEVRLVLTDLMMPVMDGTALVGALQRLKPGLPIIVATGVKGEGTGAGLARAGVSHVLAKPYTASDLLQLLHRLLTATPGP